MKLTHRPLWMLFGIVCIAANLRAPITGLPTLIGAIQADIGISATTAGLLTTTPLLVFAIVSLLSARVAAHYGLERSLFYALCFILGGVIVRSLPSVSALFLGNNIIAMGISLANVLLPSLIKRDFPYRVAFMTALYSLTMGLMAALISTISTPLAAIDGVGWRYSLLAIGIMTVISIVVWKPQLRHPKPEKQHNAGATVSLWRTPLAWQVAFFFGMNSLHYYIIISWLPSILENAGFSASYAGSMHGILQLATAFSGLVIVPLVARFNDQRPVVLLMVLPVYIGLLGILFMPAWSLLWSPILGLGAGGVFVLGLSFISMRVSSAAMAASLSGMAQFTGYTFASTGPSLTGKLYDITGSWNSVLIVCLFIATCIATLGMFAGRNIQIKASTQ